MADLDADGVSEVLFLDYAAAQGSEFGQKVQQRVRAFDGRTGTERWMRLFPVAQTTRGLPYYSPDLARRPRISVLQRRDGSPWIGLNLWTVPEEVVVLDGQGRDVSQLQLETFSGVHTGRFGFDTCDVDADGNDEIVLFQQDSLMAVRPDAMDQPLWRWPVDTLNSHRVTGILHRAGDTTPTIVLQRPLGDNGVVGLDAASGMVRWACAGPTSRRESGVAVVEDAIVLAEAPDAGLPRIYFPDTLEARCILARRTEADATGFPSTARRIGPAIGRRFATGTDPRFLRRFPGTPPHVDWSRIAEGIAWAFYFSGFILGLPSLYAAHLLGRRRWSLKTWLVLPVVSLLVVMAILTRAPGSLYPSPVSRLFVALTAFPLLWFLYRVVSCAIRGQWGRARNRAAGCLGLVCLFASLPLLIFWITGGESLDSGER
ncbi:MAG: hypothetical protein JJ992_09585, partial [Planctomycetes bacterium]|nr:hypothetical protein [Planctomycetota bacterium]